MQSFEIAAAKRINGMLRAGDGRRRRGTVFPDRYHVRILEAPSQVRNRIGYVLNNWRHHREDRRSRRAARWQIDPFASGARFDGWKEREPYGGNYVHPPTYVAPLVSAPSTWLLSTGRRTRGLISAFERPAAGPE